MASETLSISLAELHPSERDQVQQVVQLVRRNRAIRARYAELQPHRGKWQAIWDLAEEHNLSERQIRRILYDA